MTAEEQKEFKELRDLCFEQSICLEDKQRALECVWHAWTQGGSFTLAKGLVYSEVCHKLDPPVQKQKKTLNIILPDDLS